MKPSELATSLDILIDIKQPGFVWGAPGIGKSQVMAQVVAKRPNYRLLDRRAVLLDPVDLSGLPHVNGDKMAHWCIPDWLPREGEGVLFLDELNRAPALVQNACLQLVLDRRINEYVLPDGWVVMAAGNEEGVGVSRMDSALRSRFVHMTADVDMDEWCKWAVTADIEPMVLAFIRSFPHLLHSYDKTQRAFPCPRTWEFVSRIVARNPQPDIAHGLYVGTVGEGAAIEFSAYSRMFASLPNIDAILLNPSKEKVPSKTEPSQCFAVSAALARRMTDRTIDRIMTYMGRMEGEYTTYTMQDAVRRDRTLATTKAYIKWAVDNHEVLF